jgi:uncharacterized protein
VNFKDKYGPIALIAGASEGIGAAYSEALAKRGLDLVLVARRQEPLENTAEAIRKKFKVNVETIRCDLSEENSAEKILHEIGHKEVHFLVYNAAQSFIGPFLNAATEDHLKAIATNSITLMKLVHSMGTKMIENRKGGIVIMSSLAGFQGSGFLATYAATKAFNRVFAESLWYEWKNKGVDVIACCAGATLTPGYIQSSPSKLNPLAPKAQSPQKVVEECLNKIGTMPSFIPGRGNRMASFFMQKIFSRRYAVNTMGNNTRKMYQVDY